MTGIEIFGIIAGIASIISIPIGFYFNRKNSLKRYESTKRQIIETLLHQIGTGQRLDLLGMKMIIDSKLSDNGLQADRITIQEVIADIYTNVTTNPLIEIKQKSIYLNEIKQLGLSYSISNSMDELIKRKTLPTGEKIDETDINQLDKLDEKQKYIFLKEHRILQYENNFSFISHNKNKLRLFSILSISMSVLGSILSLFFYLNLSSRFNDILKSTSIFIFVSIALGISITFLAYWYSNSKTKNRNRTERIKDFLEISEDETQGHKSNLQ